MGRQKRPLVNETPQTIMKSLVYEPGFLDRSNFPLLNEIGRKIGITHKLKLRDIKDPVIQHENYVRLKTRMCGICSTDLGILSSKKDSGSASSVFSGATKRKSHYLLGHEIVAEVVETGAKANKFKIGDRVSIADDKNCETFGLETCDFCKIGLPLQCTNKHKRKYLGNIGAGWCEYFVRHENQLFLIPESMDDDVAVLMEPATVSLHSVLRNPPKENEKILVIGGGVIGLGIISALRALKMKSLEIILLARHQFQKDKALELGADRVVGEDNTYDELAEILKTALFGNKGNQVLNNGFDRVYDCVSNSSTINDGLRWLCPRGTLILVGMDGRKNHIDFGLAVQRELIILGIHGYAYNFFEDKNQHTLSRCIDWVREGRYNVESLLTHKYLPHEHVVALKTAVSHHSKNSVLAEKLKPIKVAFDFSA
jgi:L-iditol 2-dehydrogenase